jgi:large subunit ribosomal protein L19
MKSIDAVHQDALRRDLPPFRSGDTVRVHVRIREGDKERIQVFEGVVIQRRGGGAGETFTVRKVSSGVGVERIFPVQSPSVTKLEIMRRGHVRRSRLFYLRELSGKKARLRSKVRDIAALMARPDEVGTADEAIAAEEEAEASAEAEAQPAAEQEQSPAETPEPEEPPTPEKPE